MTVTDADPLEVPWERCSKPECTGVKTTAGPCLAHLGRRQLTTALASLAKGRDLDARGVSIDAGLLSKILEIAPKDPEGRSVLPRLRLDRAKFSTVAAFEGVVFAKDVSFDWVRFEGDCSFRGARFRGNARFAGATFCGVSEFDDAELAGQGWFGGASFGQEVSFRRTRFERLAWFGRATAAGRATFDGATFGGDATFDGARFDGGAGFAGAKFHGEARLVDAEISGEPDFAGARFLGKGGAPRAAVRQAIWTGAGLASWPSRAGALLIDQVVATLISIAPVPLGVFLQEVLLYDGAVVVSQAIGILAGLVFVVRNLLTQGRTGQTLGKRRMGISLVSANDGSTIGGGRSIVRQFSHVLDSALLLVGWLWPLWDAKNQTLADKAFNTVVVRV